MIEKEGDTFVYRDSKGQEVDPAELRQALETALSHPEQPLSEFVWLFHPGCGGVINGSSGKYRCQECGGVFEQAELRKLVK
jgi:hypothetical protein